MGTIPNTDLSDIILEQLSLLSIHLERLASGPRHDPHVLHSLICSCCLVSKSCPALCDSTDYSLPGSSVRGIFQARILEWVATSYSKGSSQPRDQTWISCIGR